MVASSVGSGIANICGRVGLRANEVGQLFAARGSARFAEKAKRGHVRGPAGKEAFLMT